MIIPRFRIVSRTSLKIVGIKDVIIKETKKNFKNDSRTSVPLITTPSLPITSGQW